VEAPPNFSLRLSLGVGTGNQKLMFLHRAHVGVIRTRWRSRAVRGLLNYLGEFLPCDEGFFRVRALALVKAGRAYLVPRAIESWIVELLSAPLHRAGFQFVDVETAALDLRTRELVVPELRLEVDASALGDLQGSDGRAREPAPILPGRYPVEAWALFGQTSETSSLAPRILQLFQTEANAFDFGIPALVRELEPFAAAVRVVHLGSPSTEVLADKITALATS
jgi:hypothetical protein